MEQQLTLLPVHPVEVLELPHIEIRAIRCSIGNVRHRLRPGMSVQVVSVAEISISSRRKENLYTLSNNERIIITRRTDITRPEGVDGVLRQSEDGTFEWQSHQAIEDFSTNVEEQGWPTMCGNIESRWNGQLSFRSERVGENGIVAVGDEGLRSAQLGALHAIGAHWSIYRQPATVVMPTGTGKTEVVLATLAAYVRGPLLIIVPFEILRSQTAGKLITFGLLRQLGILPKDVPNPIVGIVTKRPRDISDLEIFERCNVVIGTMSSLGEGTAIDFAPEIANRVSTLIIDEAHHIGAPGWSQFREAFSDRRILQFTATPYRRDGKLVDGEVIYNYPLRTAQSDGYFKKIVFEPVYAIDSAEADQAIAKAAVDRLRDDLTRGYNHLLMARCVSIERAAEVKKIYDGICPELNPVLVHSDVSRPANQLADLRNGKSRVVVCVNMLGEGFDLPQLKVAAVHDLHKSLAVLLQFTGRFTRTASDAIGDAVVVANIADPNVSTALERLYSEDADWNQLLSELSSNAAQEHAALIAFLNASQRLDSGTDDTVAISHQLLRPVLSTLMFRATEFRPKLFHEGLGGDFQVHRVWLHQDSNTLYFVTKFEPYVKWTRSHSIRDREWSLFVLHYNQEQKILFLSSTDHSSLFESLAKSVGANELISGDSIFRTLGHINRLRFQNIGVKKHGRRNLRYAMYTGADVANALTISEQAGSVKSNLSGTGWEDGEPITIGCSYKGRVWSREQGPVPRFIEWCEKIGGKINDSTIDTRKIIANVLIPEECETLPEADVLGVEWPLELLGQAEERVVLGNGIHEKPISMFEIAFLDSNRATNTIRFELIAAEEGQWASFALIIGGDLGFNVIQLSGQTITIQIGKIETTLANYLSDCPPLVRFIDLAELDGNLIIRPQNPQELVVPEERFEVWDWSTVDIKKESIWKDGEERHDSIQWHAAQYYINGGFDIVFDDDAAGEAADLICIKEEDGHIRLALIHCKFSGGESAGERVKDVVEVSSQAVRSAKWKWKFRDLLRHIQSREKRLTGNGRSTRFLVGQLGVLNQIARVSRFKEIRPEILVVQPGFSKSQQTPDQVAVLGAALAYLKQTVGVDLDIICSS